MKPGDTIYIIPSLSLKYLRLEELVGRTATIVEVRGSFDNIKGCWVELPQEYLGEIEWYIPYNSIGT